MIRELVLSSRRTSIPIDVLLLQLGTPAAPTARALRPYLREFLSDPRVVELPNWARWLLVNFLIVPFRSPKSAAKYRRIWDNTTGSPLLDITRKQSVALGARLGEPFRVRFAMRYGEPSTAGAVRELMSTACERLVVLPLFPQYSATTTASALDALFLAFRAERVVPAVRVVSEFHTDAQYVDSVGQGIERIVNNAVQAPEMVLVSFHGIPEAYIDRGDPYREQCERTAILLAERMGWSPDYWQTTFQSRLGPSEWLRPYTDKTLIDLARQGLRTVLVVQPGFTADCLETIDEIGYEGRHEFQHAGGETLLRVPCVNDDPAFIDALAALVRREAQGWL